MQKFQGANEKSSTRNAKIVGRDAEIAFGDTKKRRTK